MNFTIHTPLQANYFKNKLLELLELQLETIYEVAKHGQFAQPTYEQIYYTLNAVELLCKWIEDPFSRIVKLPNDFHLLGVYEDTLTLMPKHREELHAESFKVTATSSKTASKLAKLKRERQRTSDNLEQTGSNT